MANDAGKFRRTLRRAGLDNSAIDAAWPAWWTNDATTSPSAFAELKFSLARKLGLDPRSLVDDGEPRFVWKDDAKFKGLAANEDVQRAAIESFAMALSKSVMPALSQREFEIVGLDAIQLRKAVLANSPHVGLMDLVAMCWSAGIPVMHLRVFPLSAKRMCAMSVKIRDQYFILLSKDAEYPAPIAFYLAHELGHIVLDHFGEQSAIVDMADTILDRNTVDNEELEADRFAMQLLTGREVLEVDSGRVKPNALQLAEHVSSISKEVRIEPGTLALCFGYTTGDWAISTAALRHIYKKKLPVWSQVNGFARSQFDWDALTDDTASYVSAVLGGL